MLKVECSEEAEEEDSGSDGQVPTGLPPFEPLVLWVEDVSENPHKIEVILPLSHTTISYHHFIPPLNSAITTITQLQPLSLVHLICFCQVIPELACKLRPHQREGVQFLFECVMGLRGFEGQVN